MLRRLSFAAASLAALAGCQNYRFKQVSAQPVQVVNQEITVGAKKKAPDIMIVQDTSGSMSEPIQLTAPNGGVSCLATTAAGSCTGQAGYFSSCAPGCGPCTDSTDCASKMQLTSSSMVSILNGLKPAKGALNIGLTTFPNGNQCSAGSIQVGVGDAVTTIPQVVQFYGNVTPQGGTPTSATLAIAAADPAMSNSDPTARKFILLVTDGLPNCGQTNACTGEAWSNGQDYGCASPASVAALPNAPTPTPTPPTGCVCSFGDCPVAGASDCCPISGGPSEAWYCLDDKSTESEIAALYAQQNITTYVVGMGYDYGSNSTVLDGMAAAGHGNPTAFEASTPAGLQAALTSLIQTVAATCSYTLDAPPVDPGLISVTLNGTPLVAGDPNGYTYDPPDSITINGTSCTALTSQSGAAEDLKITAIAN